MGKLVEGDDGLPAEEVGEWISDKHDLLCDYVQITSATRRKFLPPNGSGGSAFIDLFCGPGRAKIKDSSRFVDGGCVAAWRKSQEASSPFSKIIIGDTDSVRLDAAKVRLERLGAAVETILGEAKDTALRAIQVAGGRGLHFAFLDPYSLGALDFSVIETLAKLRRIDMLVHVSQMDLQRNFRANAAVDVSALDAFAPGWRVEVDLHQREIGARRELFAFWCSKVGELGVWPSAEMRLIKGSKQQPLYLLLLAARHDLAHKFWDVTAKSKKQGSLF